MKRPTRAQELAREIQEFASELRIRVETLETCPDTDPGLQTAYLHRVEDHIKHLQDRLHSLRTVLR